MMLGAILVPSTKMQTIPLWRLDVFRDTPSLYVGERFLQTNCYSSLIAASLHSPLNKKVEVKAKIYLFEFNK